MCLAAIHRVFWCDVRDGEVSMEQLVRQVAALTQFTSELDGRLAGIGGIEGAVGLYHRLRDVLAGVAAADIDRMTEQVASLQRALADVERRLAGLRALKAALERVAEPE
jgi:prefoldin subunit 5